MTVARISELWRYPVKSLGGEHLAEVELGAGGLPGDRCWAVRDEVNGGIRGAKKLSRLMELQSSFPEVPAPTGSSPAEIYFADGSTGSTGDEDIHERLSKAVGHAVTLWPLLPADALDHYRRGAPTHSDMETELRAIFGREPDEPLPDLGAFPPEMLAYESPPGTYFDVYPLLVMTTTSLESMAARGAGSAFDVRRFRPNILVEVDDPADPFPEAAWVGRTLRIGDARLRIEMDCPRCVMTTHAQPELAKDPKIMRALVRENGGNLGAYASVDAPGRIRVGDLVEIG